MKEMLLQFDNKLYTEGVVGRGYLTVEDSKMVTGGEKKAEKMEAKGITSGMMGNG